MASPPIDVFCDPPDPSVKPQTFVEACAAINNQLRAQFAGPSTYTPYVISSSVPAVDDQDKVWIQTDGAGRPIGQKLFYNGNWRRIYTERIGQLAWFIGDPTLFFDANGHGLIGSDWDGWQMINGLNGVADWSDRFLITAHMNNTGGVPGHAGLGWWTNIRGPTENLGGVPAVQLTVNQIPDNPTPAKMVELWTASGNAPSTGGDLFGVGSSPDYTFTPADPGNTNPQFVEIIPPFATAALLVFQGYGTTPGT